MLDWRLTLYLKVEYEFDMPKNAPESITGAIFTNHIIFRYNIQSMRKKILHSKHPGKDSAVFVFFQTKCCY